ncbi:MAG: hypothetical protein M3P24_08755 [Gemmatimonadota bacterium]|nr:hypothetical protein [Gemmatimonadota bacterium]
MNASSSAEERTTQLKRDAFLRRLVEICDGDSSRWIPIGFVGDELGLPYEEALAITDHLREAGLIRRGGGGPLEAPRGPRVRVLPEGIEQSRSGG